VAYNGRQNVRYYVDIMLFWDENIDYMIKQLQIFDFGLFMIDWMVVQRPRSANNCHVHRARAP
jgi:hypothetical protein